MEIRLCACCGRWAEVLREVVVGIADGKPTVQRRFAPHLADGSVPTDLKHCPASGLYPGERPLAVAA